MLGTSILRSISNYESPYITKMRVANGIVYFQDCYNMMRTLSHTWDRQVKFTPYNFPSTNIPILHETDHARATILVAQVVITIFFGNAMATPPFNGWHSMKKLRDASNKMNIFFLELRYIRKGRIETLAQCRTASFPGYRPL